MAAIEIDRITKRFESGVEAVKAMSFDIADGEFVVLVGPSGCGKSTVLRMIAGLEEITEGEIRIDGRRINEVPPRDRDIAMVFQSYALYPHMTVAENIAFALKLHHMPHEEIERRVNETAAILELDELLDRKPKQLSGGQRQRVAMGRAIVREPQVFLMDEPLSNLDAKLRVQMRADIAQLQRRLGTTTVYVTHDQVEAMTMADRVAVMRRGELQQIDVPKVVYERPANLFVAAFIGSPPMNLVEGTIVAAGDDAVAVFGDQRIRLDASVLGLHPGLASVIATGAPVAIGIRPEDLEDASLSVSVSPPDQQIELKVDLVAWLGSQTEIRFGVNAPSIPTEEARVAKGEKVVSVPEDHTDFVASLNPKSTVVAGDTVRLAVDTQRMHFFDRATGVRL